MRITPLAVWAHKLPKDQLEQAVKLQTNFTHSQPLTIAACYLYCLAISILIREGNPEKAFKAAHEEAKVLGKRPGMKEVPKWFDIIIKGELPDPADPKPRIPKDTHLEVDDDTLKYCGIGGAKLAFIWAFHYLHK